MLLLLALTAFLQDPDVAALLKQLSDDSIETREKASRALIEIGAKAEERLSRARASADTELKNRLDEILRTIAVNRKLAETLPPLKRVTIDARESKFRDVLEDLRRQSGMDMQLEGLADPAITVRLKEATPLEALDAVCKSGGFGWFIEGGQRLFEPQSAKAGQPSIRFERNAYTEVPRVYVRHYAVAPASLNLNRATDFRTGTSSAALQLLLRWTPETKPVASWIEVASVTDDRGRPLYNSPEGRGPGFTETSGIHRSQSAHTIQLHYPEPDAKAIASVRGVARFRFLKDENVMTFNAPAGPGPHKKEVDGLTVEIKEFKPDGAPPVMNLEFTGHLKIRGPADPVDTGNARIERNQGRELYVRFKLEDGTRSHVAAVLKTEGGMLPIVLSWAPVASKVTAVEIVLDFLWHVDSFDFELKDIPLPK